MDYLSTTASMLPVDGTRSGHIPSMIKVDSSRSSPRASRASRASRCSRPPTFGCRSPGRNTTTSKSAVLAFEVEVERLLQCFRDMSFENDRLREQLQILTKHASTAGGEEGTDKIVVGDESAADAGTGNSEKGNSEAKSTFGMLGSQTSGKDTQQSKSRKHVSAGLQLYRRDAPLNLKQANSCTDAVVRIVLHPCFERCVGFVILANVVYMGWSANYQRTNVADPVVGFMNAAEVFFCVLYIIELSLKGIAYGRKFFHEPHGRWNMFDLALVIQSIYDIAADLVGLSGSGNISFLRMLRLVKMLKMLRVIKLMRSMFELRMILSAMLGSVKSMFWSIVLLTFVIYMFALVFVQGSASYLHSEDHIPEDVLADFNKYWGSVLIGMSSLFESTTGGVDWTHVAEPLKKIGWPYYVIFCVYVAFFVFVLLNTITALFVEATMANSVQDYQETIQAEMNKKDDYAASLEALFNEMDETGDGIITLEVFQNNMQDPQLVAFAASLGITVGDAESFFNVLTDGGSEGCDLDSFIQGCMRIKGAALSIDMQDVIAKTKQCSKGVQDMNTNLTEVVRQMRITHKSTALWMEDLKSLVRSWRSPDIEKMELTLQRFEKACFDLVACQEDKALGHRSVQFDEHLNGELRSFSQPQGDPTMQLIRLEM